MRNIPEGVHVQQNERHNVCSFTGNELSPGISKICIPEMNDYY